MKSVTKKDDAVSPVIGTILLVAITVVLVAIVAAVVMGMVGGVSDSKSVGVTVTPYSNGVNAADHGLIITVTSGKDADQLLNITPYLSVAEFNLTSVKYEGIGVPVSIGFKDGKLDAVNGSLTLTGAFTDGSKAVIYQGNINIPAAKKTA